MKAASYLQDVLLDPELAHSQEPNDAALNAAFNTKLSTWEWFESAGNEHRQLRFGITMEGSKQAASLNAIREGDTLVFPNVMHNADRRTYYFSSRLRLGSA